MDNIQIDFNKPCLVGNELAYIAQSFEKSHISGDGYFSKQCHQLIEKELNVAKVLLTTSCTHALEMAALLLDIQPGDEVIVPSFTFVSSINAFVLRGAVPVFVDIRPDTLNIDEEQIEQHISPRTKAIIVVHYAGVGCEMETILAVAGRHHIPVVEDNAHGLFGKYKDKYLGTFGCMATQSFHETKNITCGEGGALLINDSQYIEQAEIIREKGTNRSRFFQGLIDRYTWVNVGSSYLPSDILAAMLYGQLERWPQIQQKRKQIWEYYYQNIRSWGELHGVKLPTVPNYCDQAYHMFYLILPSLEIRKKLMAHLRERGIVTVFHYQPLHLSEYGRRFGGKSGDCPVTETVADCLLRLPFFYDLTEHDLDQVVTGLHQFEY